MLKKLLCSAAVLKVFDTALNTCAVCDVGNFCVGGVLQQRVAIVKWHPNKLYSKYLSSREHNYSTIDRKHVAIRQCLERWRHLLIGCRFTILTDYMVITYIQSSATVLHRNTRWLEFLSQFNFDIEHIKRIEKVFEDTLQHVPGTEYLDLL